MCLYDSDTSDYAKFNISPLITFRSTFIFYRRSCSVIYLCYCCVFMWPFSSEVDKLILHHTLLPPLLKVDCEALRKSDRSWFKAHLSLDIFNMGIVIVQYSKIEKTCVSLTCFIISLHYICMISMHIYCSVRLCAGDWSVTLPCRSTKGFTYCW